MERKSFYFTNKQLAKTLNLLEAVSAATMQETSVLGIIVLVTDMAAHTDIIGPTQVKISLPDVAIKVLTECVQSYLDFIIRKGLDDDERVDAQMIIMSLNKAA